MDKEMEIVTLENGKEYMILERIKKDKDEYVYLSNKENENDFCIRKINGDTLYGLKDKNEYFSALSLLKDHNKELFSKVNIES